MFRKPLILIILLFCGVAAQSQQPSLSNLRLKKWYAPAAGELILDSLSIVPNSEVITGARPDDYRIDYVNAILYLKRDIQDSLVISYRVFPFRMGQPVTRFNYDSIRYNFTVEQPVRLPGLRNEDRLIDFGPINYNGSIGRGISFGNNQDAVVSSILNLQLNGFIGDSLEFTAAISDNNIPIQPDGNTQNIQDFDRIYMQIKKGGWQVNFGDIDVRQTNNRFLSFSKRLQGASFLSENSLRGGKANSMILSGAIARGKFSRNVVQALEGNQGPYKLYGTNGELYFAVLAGTERVYINGELVERGEDRDYVIDYNTAELTFTAKRMITRDTRIQVEFEYTDRNFLNSMLYFGDEFKVNDKLEFSVAAYANTDAKNSPINQPLTDAQKQFLSTIGNKIDSAFFPDVMPDTFSVDKILYRRVDTTVNGVLDSVYVFSTDKNETLYSLSFINVGQGKGNYVPIASNANGRVFQWVAPVDGKPQGDWEPAQLLITPKKHQVVTVSTKYRVSEHSTINISGALSDYDVNTFSSIGNSDNKGTAWMASVEDKRPVSKGDGPAWELSTNAGFEYVNHKYKAPETLRGVEFYRDWGMGILVPAADEKLMNAGIGISKQRNFARYQLQNYRRDKDFKGNRNVVETYFENKGWEFNNKLYYTSGSGNEYSIRYLKPDLAISKVLNDFRKYKVGLSYLAENNRHLIKQYDTLSPLSYGYSLWRVFLKSDEQKPVKWGVSYFARTNTRPVDDQLKSSDKSNNLSFSLDVAKNPDHQFRMNVTYRKLKAGEDFVNIVKDDESLLGRAEYSFNGWNGLLSGGVFYEVGAGQEQKRQYTYLEVPAGQGFYMWVDYNGDSIPQLDEFEVAVFQDQKRWIRVLTPTNEYVKANYIQLNYNVSINPSRLKSGSETRFRKFLNRLNTTSSLQVNKKEISQGSFAFNPFGKAMDDTSLISMYSFLANSIYFNRTSPVFGLDLTHRLNTNKAVLSYGFESNSLRDLGIRSRWNMSRSFSNNVAINFRKRRLSVPAFVERNYEVKELNLEPSFSYVHKTDFRATLQYGLNSKRNEVGNKEKSVTNSITAEVRYNVFASGMINGRFSYNNISFDGNVNSPVGFLLLDGLQPGGNILWNLEFTKRIAGNIEMTLQYEGRKPSSSAVVHTGRASLRAIF